MLTTSGRYRDALAVGEFRAVFLAHVISMSGTVVANFALTVLVYQKTGSPLLASLVFTLILAPFLLAGTLLSALVDRFPPRRLLVVCNVLSALLAGAMALPGTPSAAVLVLAFVLGLVEPVFSGARAATLPDVLPGPVYVPGRSLMRLVSQGAQMGGFALSGVLLTVASPSVILLGNAVSFLVSAVLLQFGTRERTVESVKDAPRPALLKDSLGGLGAVLKVRPLRRVLLLGWAVPMLGVAPEALAVPYAGILGAGSVGAGLLLTANPIGTVLGELLSNWRLSAATQVRVIAPAAALVFLPLVFFLFSPGVALTAVLLVVSGLGSSFHLGQDRVLLEVAPEHLRARALSIQTAGLMFWQGLGFAAAGAAAEFASPTVVVPVAAALGLLSVLLLADRARSRATSRTTESQTSEGVH
ncbi:MFS transporter [Kitasatospora sp. CMC57]|uniref:MFS transporter n=1 Tax=Kitasatospora sp. CMC57 TaxID=3231513 RepID=UPI0038B5492F